MEFNQLILQQLGFWDILCLLDPCDLPQKDSCPKTIHEQIKSIFMGVYVFVHSLKHYVSILQL